MMKKNEKIKRKYINTTELCVLFPISKQTVYNWRKEGMPFYGTEGMGNPKFYIESEVIAWLATRDNTAKVEEVIQSNYLPETE